MPLITLTTDFGEKDGFVGSLKGVIWGICPGAQIAEISNQVDPQDVLQGGIILWRSYPYFPPGTVHCAVVDPGVGTDRKAIAFEMNRQYFVGPDNGIFTFIYDDAKRENWAIDYTYREYSTCTSSKRLYLRIFTMTISQFS